MTIFGRWQREMPQKIGMYWTRTSDGLEAGIEAVCALPDGQLFTPRYMNQTHAQFSKDRKIQGESKILPGTTWGGWWWSEPVPECPPWEKPV